MKDETGATAVEYGVMVAGIASAVILAAYALGVRADALIGSVPWP